MSRTRLTIAKGATSQIIHVFLEDSTVTTGAGKTALAFGDITAYYARTGGALTALTLVDITTLGTWDTDATSDKLGFKLLHDTNAPGVYEVHLSNNVLATGADRLTIQLRATGMKPHIIEIQLADAVATVNGAIADAVLDELLSGHTTPGTLGRELHLCKAALLNKRTQNVRPADGKIKVYDDDGTTLLVTLTPSTDADDPTLRIVTPS